MNDENLQSLWQSQPNSNKQNLSHVFEQNIQHDIRGFRHKIARRNQQESICAVIVMCIFGYYCWALPEFLMRVGSGLIVLGSAAILYQLQFRAALQELPAEQLGQPFIIYYRSELMRQRNMLRSIWLYQFCPLLPGISIFFWGMAQPNPADFPWQITSVVIVPFLVVLAMNLNTARKIQIEINKLNQEIE
jgi:hypothetical protein